ncbi:MAG: hypothetical protein ACOYM3_08920 [Terrimicrobiaceae bacterium]
MSAHQLKAEEIQKELIRKMTPGQRLSTAMDLYQTAWEIKKSGLRSLHPEWTEDAVQARTRRVFVTGYAGD